jgi:2,4-dienoyl-CoA reductase-like NADH-dependent reductase (Old Yellow Enzyme family)
MSGVLFEKVRLGRVELPNRFVRSATYESMATQGGAVTPDLVRYYRTLGNGHSRNANLPSLVSSIERVLEALP